MCRPVARTEILADARARYALVGLVCDYCDAPIVVDEPLVAGLCEACGREYVAGNPDALGPDA